MATTMGYLMNSNRSIYAKVDQAHLADGLFVPSPRGRAALAARRRNMDATYRMSNQTGQNIEVRFLAAYQPTTGEQSVLLVACAWAARRGELLIEGDEYDLRARKIKMLDHQLAMPVVIPSADRAVNLPIASATITSAWCLLVDCGIRRPAASDYRWLEERLIRMGNIRMIVTRLDDPQREQRESQILDSPWRRGGAIQISLNWRLARAILGGGAQHSVISLLERAQLRSDPAKLLHAFISGHTRWRRRENPFAAGRAVEIDPLARHIWGPDGADFVTMDRRLAHKRRAELREALDQLATLAGWRIDRDAKRVIIIRGTLPLLEVEGATVGDLAGSDDFGDDEQIAMIDYFYGAPSTAGA